MEDMVKEELRGLSKGEDERGLNGTADTDAPRPGITDEMVEAAAAGMLRAINELEGTTGGLTDGNREYFKAVASRALEAASEIERLRSSGNGWRAIRAELLRLATDIGKHSACSRCHCASCSDGYENHSHGCTDGPHCIETKAHLLSANRALRFTCGQTAADLRRLASPPPGSVSLSPEGAEARP